MNHRRHIGAAQAPALVLSARHASTMGAWGMGLNSPSRLSKAASWPSTAHGLRQQVEPCASSRLACSTSHRSGTMLVSGLRRTDADVLERRQSQQQEAQATDDVAVTFSPFQTGGSTRWAGQPLGPEAPVTEKRIVLVRHGMTTWNEQSRIQGSSDLSELTQYGEWQASRVRAALENIPFDGCFSSPISRAKQTAHIIWEGKPLEHLRYLDDLREADLGWFQGMSNKQAAEEHSEMYRTWRDNPAEFVIEGRNPVLEVFEQAKQAWSQILSAEGHSYLVVTHKSVLRALLCTSLGLPASSFRVLDINNAGVCMLKVNCRGEPMLSALNLTSHIHAENVHY